MRWLGMSPGITCFGASPEGLGASLDGSELAEEEESYIREAEVAAVEVDSTENAEELEEERDEGLVE